MRKLLLVLFLLPSLTLADTVVDVPIVSDTTWSPTGGVYLIDSSFRVASGTTLTIEAGTIIKGRVSAQSVPTIYGTLVAQGALGAPIVFTSLTDDSFGGDTNSDATSTLPGLGGWQGLYFEAGSTGNLDYVHVAYAGYGGFNSGEYVGIENNGGDLYIDHSSIHDHLTGIYNKSGNLTVKNSVIANTTNGINVISGTSTIIGSVFQNNSGYALYYQPSDRLDLDGNSFVGNGRTATIFGGADFIHENNTSSDLSHRGFQTVGALRDGSTIHSRDLPTIVEGSYLTILQGQTLNIAPGAVIKFGTSVYSGSIEVRGTLIAKGTPQSKIYFTSLTDDTVGGDTNADGSNSLPAARDWQAFFLQNGSNVDLDNAVIRYGGFNFNGEYMPGVAATIYNRGANLNISNSFVEDNFGIAIYQDVGSTTISHTEFTKQSIGIQFEGGVLSATNNNFHNNFGLAIDNRTATTTIDARNNWWGDPSGPRNVSTSTPTGIGDSISQNVLYTPWIGRDPSLPNPVIIVPGIMSSYLNKDDASNEEVWMNLPKMIFSRDDSYLNSLVLSTLGQEISSPGLKALDVVRTTGVPLFTRHIFDYLTEEIENAGYVENQDVFFFPYDWRKDLTDVVSDLKNKIDDIKSQTGSNKVIVVAHSMGGLLTKLYLKNFGGNSIDRFIDVATPHNGSPESFRTLLDGETDIPILNRDTIKSITQNMPSVYELLPSRDYFDVTDNDYKYYVFDGVNNNQRLTFDETKQYLKNSGRNSLLVDRAEAFHNEVDNLDPATYGVTTYNIVGCGNPTIGQIFVLDQQGSHYNYNIKMINGDGTVPLKSAEAIPSIKTYYVKGAQHATLPSTSGVKELVTSLLSTSTQNFDISSYSNLAMSSSGCVIPNGQLVSFHSPITLDVYDTYGNHAGPNANGDIENNIAGVSYEVIEDNKFAFLPDGVSYTVQGQATGSGSLDVRVETITNGDVTTTTIFNDIPLSLNTRVQFSVNSATPAHISIDNDGDGTAETSKNVSTSITGFLEGTGKDKPKSISTPITSKPSSRRILAEETQVQTNPQFAATSTIKKTLTSKDKMETATSSSPVIIKIYRGSNEASVLQSLTSSIKNLLKKWWGWLKNKL
ncbi:MAG: right-handed parallel beta-helix repeat-containing protein [Patescibacteria group bacterium]